MVGLIIWQFIEYFLKIDKISFSEEINSLMRILSNAFATNLFITAEVEEYKITPFKVFSSFKLFSSSFYQIFN